MGHSSNESMNAGIQTFLKSQSLGQVVSEHHCSSIGGDVHAIASIPFRDDVSFRLIGYFNEQPWLRRLETVSSYSST